MCGCIVSQRSQTAIPISDTVGLTTGLVGQPGEKETKGRERQNGRGRGRRRGRRRGRGRDGESGKRGVGAVGSMGERLMQHKHSQDWSLLAVQDFACIASRALPQTDLTSGGKTPAGIATCWKYSSQTAGDCAHLPAFPGHLPLRGT